MLINVMLIKKRGAALKIFGGILKVTAQDVTVIKYRTH